ncbi:dTDP-glucose 4,6-dehydratase [Pseudanabaena sp. Chao 1811]|uniref:dTDP-glucose 4,6-dehydratase n=1 Tax=Pseudanabaena sp. Chao 1811 TaxID=2963092 RepID=UPI0022F3D531|nr:dTDP-glucose 4,6-dehydratase [Pseudanabaena sp. Chao 1811]
MSSVERFQKVLITGGAGFIGSNYVHYALTHHPEWEIVVIDKLTYAGNLDNLKDISDRITFIEGDIANPEDVEKAVNGVDAILNFAAESHVDRSLRDPLPFIRTNIEGTLLLLEAARKHQIKRFLHVSTDEVYGDLVGSDRHSLETDPLSPRSPYAASKAGAEHLVFSYGISYGLDVVITRGSNTYGPYQYPEKIIPLFVTNALESKSLPIYGKGEAVRDYLYVEDHCSGIDTVLHAGESGNAYNIGARVQINGIEVATTVLGLLDRPESLMQYVSDRPGHDYRYSVDPSAAENLGWKRKWDFKRGIAQTVAWYQQNADWWQAVKDKKVFQEHYKEWYTR